MNDLEYYARNMHEWSGNDTTNVIRTFKSDPCGTSITKSQWLAERARLQNKPSWDSHKWPSIFQCESGHWFGVRDGWSLKDHITKGWKGDQVILLSEDGEFLSSGEILGDWRDSQENRPERSLTASETVSLDSALKNSTQKISGGRLVKEWKQGELPPVGSVMKGKMPSWGDWELCRIVAHDSNSCVVVTGIGRNPEAWTSLKWCDTFQPIRTEEEKAIEDMMSVIQNEYTATQAVLIEQACRRLYRAGYRKP